MANPRYEAYKSLLRCGRDSKYSTLEINSVLSSSDMESRDKALYTRLLYGVIEKKITLDHIISQFSAKKLQSLDIGVLCLLRLGVYQIMYCEKIPDSAACNESVNIAKREFKYSAPYINGVLRSVCRNKENIKFPTVKEAGQVEYLSVNYSVSPEICKMFLEDYSFERTEKIFAAMSNDDSRVTLRVNTLKKSTEELCSELNDLGIWVEKTEYSPTGLYVSHNINDIPQFESGDFMVQDVASQLCVMALGAREGDTVVDTCACPGGKSFGIAMEMNNVGRIYSFDIHKSKLSLIESSANKLGIDIITIGERDGRNPQEELFGKADKVLCDLPCSGFGVMKKKPELRYKDLEMTKRLPEIQLDILRASAKYLKKGGEMVFSTCTLSKKENESVLRSFLDEFKNFETIPFEVGGIKCEEGVLTLFPDVHKTDGFFISKMKKIN
ncbi:MAG: 16S rRNA (cytosine(967)-C(5))-methyltransferase RsmB [Ruminococcaceae bacterium]|nr:16S rRNA (cytosine(967)-C(5))-methyltransferase RsmB [Oscillospiraceae bacterium]